MPRPSVMSPSRSCRHSRPSRHEVQLPHDSEARKRRKYLATSTMQVSSSITIMPPEPIMEPSATSVSKSTGTSSLSAGRQPPDGPPVCTALNALPPGMPPPASKTISRSVMPIGTSTSPVLLTLPTSEKILVPGEPSVPMERNQRAAVEHDVRHVRPGLDVVDVGRPAPQAVLGEVDEAPVRHPAAPLERGHHGARLAADEGAAAAAHAHVERQAAAQDVVAEQARARAPARWRRRGARPPAGTPGARTRRPRGRPWRGRRWSCPRARCGGCPPGSSGP